MAMPLHDLLEDRFGVGEEAFTDALAEFADRAGPLAVVDVRPADYLGDRQQAALLKLGSSLKPLRVSELGSIAGLAVAHAELIAQSHTVADVATLLGVDTSRVRQRIYARSLYGFKHRATWLIPAFQLDGRRLVPGLETVVAALPPALHPVAVSRWFTTANADLVLAEEVVPPITWLASGGPPEPVASLAGGVDSL